MAKQALIDAINESIAPFVHPDDLLPSRLTLSHKQLDFRLEGRRRVKEMLQALPASAAAEGVTSDVRCSRVSFAAPPSTRLGGYTVAMSDGWRPPLEPGCLSDNARVAGVKGQ